jgi:hypothetical protein
MIVLYYGFDFATSTVGAFGNTALASTSVTAADAWDLLVKPRWLYHNLGVATRDHTIRPPSSAHAFSTSCFGQVGASSVGGTAYGVISGSGGINTPSGAYSGATTVPRATWATAQGHQVGIVRSLVEPALSANEYWFAFDLYSPYFITGTVTTAFMPTEAWKQIFKWGDVTLRCKSSSYSAPNHTWIIAIYNGASEVATVTVGGLDLDQAIGDTNRLHVRLRVKLHATTGLIDCTINGVAQSVSYTNQNTVATTLEAAATEIYFGPMVADNGTLAHVGLIDNILIDDTAFPSGRPVVRLATLNADDTLTNAEAAGTTPTTVVNALSSATDAKQLRFTASNGTALLTVTWPSTSGFSSDILGVCGFLSRAANRSLTASRAIGVRLETSGANRDASRMAFDTLPASSVDPPPETNGLNLYWENNATSGGTQLTTSSLSATKIQLYAATA